MNQSISLDAAKYFELIAIIRAAMPNLKFNFVESLVAKFSFSLLMTLLWKEFIVHVQASPSKKNIDLLTIITEGF